MNAIVTAVIFFFIVMTIREVLLILENHPIFTWGIIIFMVICAFNSVDGGVITKFFKVVGIIIVTIIVLCFIGAINNVKEETNDEHKGK